MKENTRQFLINILWGISIFSFGWSAGWGMRGVIQPTQEEVIEEYVAPKDTLGDWEVLQMAIVMTESKFNPTAVGKDEDWGIFQITDIYSKEVNRLLNTTVYTHEDAFDIQKAVEMFGIIQEYYNPSKDIEKALKYHNRASWYKKRVYENITFIRQMESVRKTLQENKERTYL